MISNEDFTGPVARLVDSRTSPSRRRLLVAVAGVAALTGVSLPRTSGAVAGGFDMPDDDWTFRAYRKLRFAMHDEPVFWWLRATKYGLVDNRLTPLYGMEIASIFRVRTLDDGDFAVKSLEIVYSVDPVTGELLDELRNPYTGDILPITHTPVGPTEIVYTRDGPNRSTELPGARIDSEHEFSVLRHNGQVWIRDDTTAVATPTDAGRPPFLVNDLTTYQGRVDDIDNPDMPSAPATVSYQAISSWQVRMRMGDRPGSMINRGSGAKVARFEDLPSEFRQFMRDVHPELYADPVSALDKPPFRFER